MICWVWSILDFVEGWAEVRLLEKLLVGAVGDFNVFVWGELTFGGDGVVKAEE